MKEKSETKPLYNSNIPSDWEVISLGNLGEFKNGINKDKEEFGHGFPLVNLMDVFGISKVSMLHEKLGLVNTNDRERIDFSLVKGDVLFVRSSVKPEGVGLTSLICKDIPNATYSGFLIRFRDNGKLDFDYKTHCFYEEGFRKRLLNKSTISANTNINQEALKSLKITLPPLPEQKAIAEVLSTWDKAINNMQLTIDNLQLRKKWLMQQLLTGKKRLKGFEKEKWKEIHLCEIIEEYKETTNSDNEYEVLTSAKRGLLLQKDYFGTNRITGRDNSGFNIIPPGYITYRSRSDDGVFTFNQNNFNFSGIISIYYPVFKIVNASCKFFVEFCNFHQTSFKKYSVGTSQLVLSMNDLKSAKFYFPNQNEQIAIAKVLKTVDKEIQLLKSKTDKLREQKKGLMQQLLTGKIRLYYE